MTLYDSLQHVAIRKYRSWFSRAGGPWLQFADRYIDPFFENHIQSTFKHSTTTSGMKSPSILRVLSRPTVIRKPYCQPKTRQTATLNVRKFSATPRRPFLDECLVQSHTFISAIHDMTGLPWVASIPLTAFLVRVVILHPLHIYTRIVNERQVKVYFQLAESKIGIEKKIKQEHSNKSERDRQKIQAIAVDRIWRKMVKQNRAQHWRSHIAWIKIPVWFTMMETVRRMTGTEDGMLTLTAKSLTALMGKQGSGPGTTDELIPMEPSLATEGMLWFNDLMMPDSSLILPFALSGIIFAGYSLRRGTLGFSPTPGSTLEGASRVLHLELRRRRMLKFGTLLAGPATLMFPSAMLLYWISSTLTAVMLGSLRPRTLFHRMIKPSGKGEPGGNKHRSKPKMQEFRGPTMQDLRDQKKKK